MRMGACLPTDDAIMAARTDEWTQAPEEEAEPRPEARRRAAAYLDLWERQLCITAARGNARPATWPKPRT
jgi:hypothetical protein